ncbi:hypothetical protein EV384_2633 [Micromonospora kangleipakensis]|uniref:Flagellar basal body-associated protein FliL n=1 Tax=Micromonospora kangleipakensis TaxID=1077942 RepID=A0A4Q8B905_9ACTN|nr:hypothetical protein [Micromonospora kangleipakensis]RZU74190.1 hypothetical protein EV384_2633 [Micromonospora kangleipakensis]
MSQPPSNPYPGSYPPPQQPGGYPSQQPGPQYGGGYPPQQSDPQYGGGYPPQQPGPQYGGGYPPQHSDPQYGGGYPPQQPGPQYGGGYPGEQPASHAGSYLESGQPSYGAPAGPPPKKSNVGRILLITLAVVVVLCLGGGAVLVFAAKDKVGDVVDATKTRLVAPATLAGKPKVTDPQLTSAAEQMSAEMKKDVPDATSTVGAFYGNPAKKDLVMIAGASGVLADPKKELEDGAKSLSSELAVTTFSPVDAGPLGGDAKCGDGKIDGSPVGVCIWADRGSLGVIIMYFKSADDLKSQFATMRGQIEQKG